MYIIKQITKFRNTLSTFDIEGLYNTQEGAEKRLAKIFAAARNREGIDAYYGKPGFGTLKVVSITDHNTKRSDTYILISMTVNE